MTRRYDRGSESVLSPTVRSSTSSVQTVGNGSGASAVNVQDGGNSLTVDGSVTVSGTVVATGPLTDAQLRAVAVPVSGTVTASGPLTDTQLRAAPVPIYAYGKTGDSTYQVPRIDTITHALTTISYEHHEIHDGDTFHVTDVIAMSNGQVVDYLVTTPDTTRWAHFGYEIDPLDAGITLGIFEDAIRTGTTALVAYNRNRNSAVTATTTMHRGHSGGSTDGTQIVTRRSGTKSIGASTGDSSERIMKQNSKYIIRVTNLSTTTNNVSLRFFWYEHTNRTA